MVAWKFNETKLIVRRMNIMPKRQKYLNTDKTKRFGRFTAISVYSKRIGLDRFVW